MLSATQRRRARDRRKGPVVRTRIVLGRGTGPDDAFPIMFAALHPAIGLIAVSTVNGNVTLADTSENTLRVLDDMGAEVPVYAGAARPILRPDFPVPPPSHHAGRDLDQRRA